MDKARSRLQSAKENFTRPAEAALATRRPSLLVRYLRHLPTLIISFPFAAATYYIFTSVQPATIAHLPIPNAYLLLLIPFFLCLFWLLSFIFLKARRGLLASALLTLYLFLRLQQVVFSWEVVAIPLLITVGLELLSLLVSKFTLGKR